MEQITISQNENQIINLYSNEPQIISLSNTNSQDININQNEIQDINIKNNENQILYIEGNGNIIGITDVLVNGISVVSDGIAYVTTPTKTSELINDSGFITSESDPTIPSYIKSITQADINSWNNKQSQLVSGINIKTLNDESILGSGNIEIDIPAYTSGTGIDITNYEISNTITSYNDLTDLPTIPTQTSDLTNDSDFVTSDELSDVAFSGSYTDLSNAPDIPTDTSDLINDSGFIDKDVNDLTYYTLTSDLSSVATSGDYNDLTNKPSIPTVNDGTLTIQENGTLLDTFTANSSTNKTVNITVPTKTSDLINDNGFITNNYEVYSSSEIRIGTWIDGKPLYRRVYNYTLTSSAYTFTNYSINLSNINLIYINGNSFIKSTGGNFYQINIGRYQNNEFAYNGEYSWFRINSNNITYAIGNTLTGGEAYIIVEYTKTTD